MITKDHTLATGCTKPGCTVPAYGTQAHHAARDWTYGGLTNVDDLALACGPDNRMVGPEGWSTRLTDDHDVEWIPPPHLDTGQTRINHYHRPEDLHPPPTMHGHPSRRSTTNPSWTTRGQPTTRGHPTRPRPTMPRISTTRRPPTSRRPTATT
ncbi:MAG: hypothetical protein QOF88_729 [Mycobacterium sp.]|nr:hypothetical protein [Mycobacterium sp.]